MTHRLVGNWHILAIIEVNYGFLSFHSFPRFFVWKVTWKIAAVSVWQSASPVCYSLQHDYVLPQEKKQVNVMLMVHIIHFWWHFEPDSHHRRGIGHGTPIDMKFPQRNSGMWLPSKTPALTESSFVRPVPVRSQTSLIFDVPERGWNTSSSTSSRGNVVIRKWSMQWDKSARCHSSLTGSPSVHECAMTASMYHSTHHPPKPIIPPPLITLGSLLSIILCSAAFGTWFEKPPEWRVCVWSFWHLAHSVPASYRVGSLPFPRQA